MLQFFKCDNEKPKCWFVKASKKLVYKRLMCKTRKILIFFSLVCLNLSRAAFQQHWCHTETTFPFKKAHQVQYQQYNYVFCLLPLVAAGCGRNSLIYTNIRLYRNYLCIKEIELRTPIHYSIKLISVQWGIHFCNNIIVTLEHDRCTEIIFIISMQLRFYSIYQSYTKKKHSANQNFRFVYKNNTL